MGKKILDVYKIYSHGDDERVDRYVYTDSPKERESYIDFYNIKRDTDERDYSDFINGKTDKVLIDVDTGDWDSPVVAVRLEVVSIVNIIALVTSSFENQVRVAFSELNVDDFEYKGSDLEKAVNQVKKEFYKWEALIDG